METKSEGRQVRTRQQVVLLPKVTIAVQISLLSWKKAEEHENLR